MDDRLVKLLGLTQSSNDHEALVAVRKANEHIRAAGKTWEQAFEDVTKVEERPKKYDDPLAGFVYECMEYCLKHIKRQHCTLVVERQPLMPFFTRCLKQNECLAQLTDALVLQHGHDGSCRACARSHHE